MATCALFPGTATGPVLFVVIGFAMVIQMTTNNNFLQSKAPVRLRGRVVAAYTTTFVGLLPVGCLVMGRAADLVGIRAAMVAGAALSFLWAMAALRRLGAVSASY